MKRNLRSHSRIDYKVLNSTGEKITKVTSDNVEELSELLDNISIEDSMDKVLVEESTLSDDIVDFIDENLVEDLIGSTEELDAAILKVENLRTKYRKVHKELEQQFEDYNNTFKTIYEEKVVQIKDYIKTCKEAKRIIRTKRAKEITSENESNERTVLFIIKEARRIILEIQSEFKKDFNNIDNDEIIRRKAEFSENIKKVENVSKRFQQILQSKFTTRHIDDEVTNLTKMYEKLLFNKDMYEIQLKKEVEIRELEKHNLFKEAN